MASFEAGDEAIPEVPRVVHSVEEASRIRTQAIYEHFIPTRDFDEFKELRERSGESICQWCLQNYEHKSKSECPAGDLELHSSKQTRRYIVPIIRPRTKENAFNASIQVYLPAGSSESDVRQLLEPFGPLYRVMIHELRHEDFATSLAMVGFVHLDDAERALVKLKEDGMKINWVI